MIVFRKDGNVGSFDQEQAAAIDALRRAPGFFLAVLVADDLTLDYQFAMPDTPDGNCPLSQAFIAGILEGLDHILDEIEAAQ